MTLSPSTTIVAENGGASGASLITLTRSDTDISQSATATLTSSDTTEIIVPPSVTFPAGFASVNFYATPIDDTLTDGNQPVTITANLNGPATGYSGTLNIDTAWGNSGWAGYGAFILGGIVVQPDNKVIMAGTVPGTTPNLYDFRVTRLTATGQYDNTFGVGGHVTVDVSGVADKIEAVALLPDGKILVGGIGGNGPNYDFVLARLNSDGSLDASFDGDGKLFLDMGPGYYNEIWDLAVQPDGKIVLAGNVNSSSAVTRLNADGSLDSSFATNGTANVSFSPTAGANFTGVALQPDGKIVVAGTFGGGSSSAQFAVARLNSNGTLDTGFGGGGSGKILTNFTGDYDNAQDVAVLPDGKIVVVGQVGRSGVSPPLYDVGIIRYNANGIPDSTFGTAGQQIYTAGSGYYSPVRVLVQPSDGRMVVSSTTGNTANNVKGQILRFSPTGTLETTKPSAYVGSYNEALALGNDGAVYFGYRYSSASYVERYKSTPGTTVIATGTAGLTVTDNEPFSAVADSYAVYEDGTLTVSAANGVLANDIISRPINPIAQKVGEPGTYGGSFGPTNGTVTLNANGSFTYVPNPNFNGTDTFSYRINDGSAYSNTVTVTLNVVAVNDVPVAVNDSYTTDEDTPLVVNTNVPTHTSGTSLALQSQPGDWIGGGQNYNYGSSPGTYSLSTYTNGARLTYSNGNTYWNFTFTPPTTQARLTPGTYLNATRFNSSTNPGIDVTSSGRGSNQTSGKFTVLQAEYGTNGGLLRLAIDFEQRSDNSTGLLLGQVRYNALSPSGNGVLINDTDADAQPLTAVVVSQPANGTVALNANGNFTYTPNPNYNGNDSFTYKANDGTADSNLATVNITVNPVADAPLESVADSYTVREDGVLATGTAALPTPVLAYDFDEGTSGNAPADDNGSAPATPGTFVGAATRTPTGVSASTLNLTNGGHVTAGSPSDVNSARNLTVTLWVNLRDAAARLNGKHLIGTGTDNFYSLPAGARGWSVGIDGFEQNDVTASAFRPTFSIADGGGGVSGLMSPETLDASDKWLFLAATFDGDLTPGYGVMTLFGGGTGAEAVYLNRSALAGESISGTTPLELIIGDTTGLPAWLDDVRVYDQALTQAAIERIRQAGANVSRPGVLANDPGPSSPTPTANLLSEPSHGTVSFNPDGSFVYAPEPNYHGPDSFTYEATDGTTSGGTATVSINVTAVNDAPKVQNISFVTTPEDTPLLLASPNGFFVEDIDAATSSAPLELTIEFYRGSGSLGLTPAAGATVSGNNTDRSVITGTVAQINETLNTLLITPVANSNDTNSPQPFLIVTITDLANGGPGAQTGAAWNGFGVTPVNDAPAGFADTYTLDEDTTLSVPAATGVMANDDDVDDDDLTAVIVSEPAHGSVTLNPDGTFTYVPAAGYIGSDSFTYKPNDGTVDGNEVTVSLTILEQNDPPASVADAFTTDEDTVVSGNVLANDSDADEDTLTAELVADAAHGTLTLNSDGSFDYAPDANYHGLDSFTYKAFDGSEYGAVTTVSITVNSVNDAPVAVADTAIGNEDTALFINVLGNDSDADGNLLTPILVSPPAHGTVTVNVNRVFHYIPDANYNGPDSFTYKVSDGSAESNTVTVSLTIRPVNDAPTSVADSYTTNEDSVLTVPVETGVLANDSDAEGATLTAAVIAQPTHGTLSLNPDGSFVYTPAGNYNGGDSFTYRASDGSMTGALTTVSITVSAVNDVPVAVADSVATDEDTSLTINVLANDSDADGNTLTPAVIDGPAHGTLTPNANGTFTYAPAANYNGSDSFTYKVSDGTANSETVTVSINVQAVNDTPVSVADSYSTNEDTALSVPVETGALANDSDVESALTAVVVAQPGHGTVALNPNGSFTYTPAANYNGSDSFTYKASDGTAFGAVTTVSITVASVNDAPLAVADSVTTDEDTSLTINVLANDSDADGNPLTPSVVSGPAHGTLTPNANGTFTYAPTANYNGSDSFTYKVSDGTADSGTVTVSITVRSVNDTPVSVTDSYSTNEDTPLWVPVPTGLLANDTDVDGSLTAVVVTQPSHGTLSLNPDGSFSYTPAANFNGPDSFTYKASDGTAFGAVTTVSITVNAVNDVPVAVADSVATDEDTTLNGNVLVNDTDADGNTLTATALTQPARGTLTFNANGSFTYVPVANYNGPDSFAYKVNDGTTDSNVATVSITVRSVNDLPVSGNDSYSVREDGILVVGPSDPLPTPVLAYNFDEAGTGTTPVLDRGSAPTTNGTFSGVATRTANGVAGSPTGALSLSSGVGSVTPGAASDLNSLSSMTMTMWVNVRDAVAQIGGKRLIGTGPANIGSLPANTRTWRFGFDDFNLGGSTAAKFRPTFAVAESNGNGGYGATGLTAPETLDASNKWVFLAVTFQGGWIPETSLATIYGGTSSAAVSYLNSSAFNGESLSGFNPQNLIIGDPSGGLPAWMDDIRIYNQALSQADVERIRQAGAAVNFPGVLANDTDADGSPLTAGIVANPAHGTVSLGTDGRFTYTPNYNYNGPDSFTYRANDGTADGNLATVSLNVTPANDAPKLYSVSYMTTLEDTPISFASPNNFLLEDGDSASTSAPLKLTIDFLQGSGSIGLTATNGATVTGNNSTVAVITGTVAQINATLNTLVVTPVANSNDTSTTPPTLRLTADDQANGGPGAQTTATWGGFGVTPVNDAPSFTKGANQVVNDNVGAVIVSNWATAISRGPSDESGQTVTFEVTNNNPSLFAVAPTIDSTGTLRYTPAANTNGTATISVQVRDNGGTANGGADGSAIQTASITVRNVPSVVSTVVNDGQVQRSRLTKIAVTFDGLMDTSLLTPAAFTLKRTGNNVSPGAIAVALSTVGGRTVATLTFSGSNTESGSLIDGRWTLTVLASRVRDASSGLYMAANYTHNLHRIFGDGDGDGDVDSNDRTAFNAAYGSNSSQSAYRAWFDYDLSGVINNTDKKQFDNRYGKSV